MRDLLLRMAVRGQAAAGREFSPHLIHRCAGRYGAPLDARRDFDPRVFLFVHGKIIAEKCALSNRQNKDRMLTLIALTIFDVQSPAMPEMQPPPALPKSQPFMRRNSTVIKLFGVGALILVMLIPLAMIRGVLSDRLERRNEAVSEITDSWGKAQNIIGPVLGVPFQYKFKSMKDTTMPDGHVERREVEEMLVANAFFLPELLKIVSDAQTQTLHRGIYDAAVFRAEIKLTGKFAPPDFGALKIDLKDVQWKDAFVTIAASDLRGTQ